MSVHTLLIFSARRTVSKLRVVSNNAGLTFSRTYVKAFRRNPIKVFTRDGKDITPRQPEVSEALFKPKIPWHVNDGEALQEDHSGRLRYHKLNDTDKRFKNLHTAANSKKSREKKGVTILEGKKLICDALKAGAQLKGLYFTYPEILEGMPLEGAEGKLFKVSQRQLMSVTDVSTPPGIVALCEIPNKGTQLRLAEDDLYPITLVCDNVRDPGNMGTLLRSASAVGCSRVLVSEGCVDVWDPKVIRAGAGSHFQIKILHKLQWHSIYNYISLLSSVNLAESQDSTFSTSSKDISEKNLRHGEKDYSDSNEDNLDSTTDMTGIPGGNSSLETLPLCNVYDVDFPRGSEVVLIVGNETRGLSKAAYKLAAEREGRRVYLPMKRGVNSLNAAMAGTTLMFEIRRQLYKQKEETSTQSS